MRCPVLCMILCIGWSLVASAADPKAEAREALWAAVRSGDEKAIVAALDKGADVNATNEYGVSALWIASSKGRTEVVELLLRKGADPSARDAIWYQTPLSHALGGFGGGGTAEARLKNAKLLLKAGAKDVDAATLTAAKNGNLVLLQAILDTGKVKQDARDAALFATTEDKKDIREALTKAGAKPLPAAAEKDREAWKSLTGSYESEYGSTIKIEVKESGLEMARTVYKSTGPDTFAPIGVEESSLTFERKDGKVSRVVTRRFTAETVYFPAGSKPVPKAVAAPKDVAGGKTVAPANWPQFRGIDSTGVADGQDPPLVFDGKDGTNVLWKTPIPGLGHSCPVVWGDRVFLTTAVGGNTSIVIGNYGNPASVKDEGVPKIKRHLKGSHANCTVATDGRRLVVCFGSEGLYCYGLDGKQLWKRDLGSIDSSFTLDEQYEWGFSASPVLHEDRVILQCDLSRDSFIAAYSLTDGSQMWTTPRDEIPSWSSPVVWKNAKRTEIVTNASQYARGYDPATGKELWRLDKKSEVTVPTPVLTSGLAFVVSGNRPIQPLFAIKPGAAGNISLKEGQTGNASVAWGKLRGGPYMPTPIAYGDYLYTIGNSGMVTCYEASTGKEIYKERLSSASHTASPVVADGRLYFTSEPGEVRVLKAGPEFDLLAVNKVGEECMATPAICGGALLVRTKGHLVAFGRK